MAAMMVGMKRIIPGLALLAAAAPATAAERRYTVTDFDRIRVEGHFEVKLSTGRSPFAVARGSNAAIDRVSIDVQGRTLRIKPNRSVWGGYPGEGPGPITIELGTHDLRGASLQGPGSLSIDKARPMRFEMSLSGSGRMSIGALRADTADIALVGSGAMTIGGSAKSVRATVEGAGDLDASSLGTEDAQINSGSSGQVSLAVKRSAKVNASGAGDVVIIGDPACDVDARGSGRVICGR